MRGPPMPAAASVGQRACRPSSNKPASRSPEVSPATIASCGHARLPGAPEPAARVVIGSPDDAAARVDTVQKGDHPGNVASRQKLGLIDPVVAFDAAGESAQF